MPNSFDSEGRGPTNGRLFVAGVSFLLIVAAVTAVMIAKYKGRLDPIVRVSAELVNVGDGLPAKSDVKFRGVLVGSVSDVVPAGTTRRNIVRIDLKPQYVSGIPTTVTARVVPSNVFAVSSVQLVDNGKSGSAPLRAGAVIPEDQSLPTVLFQTTLNRFRQVLTAMGREPAADSIGWLTTLGEATQGRGDRLKDAGRDLNDIVSQLNTVVGDDTDPTTISALTAAADRLRDAAPDLFDALTSAVKLMQTLAEKRSALTDFVSTGLSTVGKLANSLDNQTDRLINITTQLTPVMGVFADNADTIEAIMHRIDQNVSLFNHDVLDPQTHALRIKAIISFTPTRTYVRADCPRYGDLLGPSCFTAPEVPVAPSLTPALGSRGLPLPPGISENRPNLAPPRDSMTHAGEANGVPPAPAGPPLGPQPTPPVESPVPPPLPAESPQSGMPSVQPQSAVVGGNVGPVGSRQEKDQLSVITGSRANAATELLLGPLARGSTVHLAPDSGGDR
ncbi:MlaD family protein [Mycobacterium intracellulare]|uniref:MlaD family protein n=1 Tax=Mycobacterium intracellulare TaxID=1767 RepID=UPI001EEEB3C6|nr:MCE family protein [Mycobacterium intracellulare]MEE3753126.1 MCE family protein [Mycobacterium intracellulare]